VTWSWLVVVVKPQERGIKSTPPERVIGPQPRPAQLADQIRVIPPVLESVPLRMRQPGNEKACGTSRRRPSKLRVVDGSELAAAAVGALVNGTRDALVPSFQTHSLSSLSVMGRQSGIRNPASVVEEPSTSTSRVGDHGLSRTGSPRTHPFDNAQSHCQSTQLHTTPSCSRLFSSIDFSTLEFPMAPNYTNTFACPHSFHVLICQLGRPIRMQTTSHAPEPEITHPIVIQTPCRRK